MVSLAIAGCASKKIPNSAADLGLDAATPGSAQDFTVNVGDRIFFDTDSSVIRADAQATLSKQAQWLNQYGTTPSPSKAMPTSAARASTTSRSALAALPRPATS